MINEIRLAVITGASSGVGAATARALARNGTRVVLVARSAEALRDLAAEIGPTAFAHPCDAADPDAVADLAETVLAQHGVPDAVFNCAGAGQWKTLTDTAPQEVIEMLNAPALAALLVSRAFLPALLAEGRGVLIHVNSPACIAPWPSSVGYATARFALRGFHEALAQDLVGTGVHSCHVIFGQIRSEYFDNNPGTLEKMPAVAKWMPTLSPEDCAHHLMRHARSPRHDAIHPWPLRVLLGVGSLTPGLTRWLARL